MLKADMRNVTGNLSALDFAKVKSFEASFSIYAVDVGKSAAAARDRVDGDDRVAVARNCRRHRFQSTLRLSRRRQTVET